MMRFLSILTMALFLFSCQNNAQDAVFDNIELTSHQDSVSYSIGFNIGQSFKQQSIDVNAAVVVRAMQDVLGEKETMMTEEQIQQVWMSYQQEMMERQEAERATASEKNKTDGEAFLKANAEKEGVVVLESGVQYKVITMGEGPKPMKEDKVKCNYKGTLIDGKEFDSSYKRGEPAVFPVTGVIAGWTEVLQLMPVGSTWEIYLPSDLAYGERGAGQDITPNATLIFTIELIEIEK